MREDANQRPAQTDEAQKASEELKEDVAAAVTAAPDELKDEAAAAAVKAAPDKLKKAVTAAAVEAVPDEMKGSAAAAAVEAVVAAKDSERSDLEETVARAVRKELQGPPLVNYKGQLAIDVVAEGGQTQEIAGDRTVSLRGGGRYSLVVKIGTATADAGLTLPLQISDGVDAERVDFSVMLNGDDPGLRQPPQLVTVATPGGSANASFPLDARWEEPTRLWIRVAQHGQFIQHVELTVLPPLVNYMGWLGIGVVAEGGDRLEIGEDRSVSLRRDGHYSLVLKIGTVAAADAGLRLPLQISDGVDAERVDFSVLLSGDDPGLRQPPQSVTVRTASGSASASFPLQAQWDEPARLSLRVTQHRQVVQHVELKILTRGRN